ncbi:MAG: glycosyltransferase family 1 protein [Parcubacteria group bacterium]|jgi:glycosyltransferase involved in cell wall biosynthesis
MKIAIQASDLDSKRIDGTRVYLLNMLNRFGKISPDDDFFIFHKKDFNSELAPEKFYNYKIIKKPFPFCWTQTRFSFEIWKENYGALWMPMQALPFVRRKNLKTTITIHDLAFKYFPQLFPRKDLRRLNIFTDFAIKNSDKIIAVSNSTKNDILKFYPEIKEEKIKVIYHGFETELFQGEIPEENKNKILKTYNLQPKNYILYVGALQPRKNLEILIKAFDKIKKENQDLKLVLAGGKAWMWEGIVNKIKNSEYEKDIIITETIPFEEVVVLYRNASVFVFPSLYEGFGIPLLEAFASGVPVISASNSSLPEVGGNAALYFNEKDSEDLSCKIRSVLKDDNSRKELIEKGNEQVKKFSWDKCARETIEVIKS